jgi:hypothetical protein
MDGHGCPEPTPIILEAFLLFIIQLKQLHLCQLLKGIPTSTRTMWAILRLSIITT